MASLEELAKVEMPFQTFVMGLIIPTSSGGYKCVLIIGGEMNNWPEFTPL